VLEAWSCSRSVSVSLLTAVFERVHCGDASGHKNISCSMLLILGKLHGVQPNSLVVSHKSSGGTTKILHATISVNLVVINS
jgi:hypothetical protein